MQCITFARVFRSVKVEVLHTAHFLNVARNNIEAYLSRRCGRDDHGDGCSKYDLECSQKDMQRVGKDLDGAVLDEASLAIAEIARVVVGVKLQHCSLLFCRSAHVVKKCTQK